MSAPGRATVLLGAALLAAAPPPARASEADAFENKVEPISGQLYVKEGRFELAPLVALSLNDAFYAKYFGGVRAGWYLSEAWSFGASFQGGVSSPTSSTSLCTVAQGCREASPSQLWQVPGDIRWIAGVEAVFSPVYGKVNVLASAVLHLDFSLLAGVDWIVAQKVLSAAEAGALAAAGGSPGTVGAPGVHLGLGTHVFLGSWVALALQLKDYLYFADVGNLQESKLQNQLFVEIGVSFFLGGKGR
jgi:outer membrane beta-barrel protein